MSTCALPFCPSLILLLQNAEDKWRPKMVIQFALLPSPLAALHDPDTVVVRRKFDRLIDGRR